MQLEVVNYLVMLQDSSSISEDILMPTMKRTAYVGMASVTDKQPDSKTHIRILYSHFGMLHLTS